MPNAKGLLVNSDYPMPWIVYKREYSFLVKKQQIDFTQVHIPHGLPFTPLLVGQWSDNADFNPAYDLAIDIPEGASGGQNETFCSVSSDSTNINVIAENNANVDRTFYLRLMGFAPPDYTGEVTPVEYTSPFRYNSKYRYQKLYLSGKTTAATVNHGLGYLPQAKVWLINNGTVRTAGAEITASALITPATSAYPYYYHIYLDPIE